MTPILYSFRRCPYAIRARLALLSAKQSVELREVKLREKPAHFLEVSPTATVPCLITETEIIDESLEIMKWALAINDPESLLSMPQAGWELIKECDGPFKIALDRTKYANRYPLHETERSLDISVAFLLKLNSQIDEWIFKTPSIADISIAPFVRQFAFIDKEWFDEQPWPNLQDWLKRFLASEAFIRTMPKYTQWKENDDQVLFPMI